MNRDIEMTLQKGEYEVTDKEITISKKILEEWSDHYLRVADNSKNESFKWGFYIGKADILINILKYFEELKL